MRVAKARTDGRLGNVVDLPRIQEGDDGDLVPLFLLHVVDSSDEHPIIPVRANSDIVDRCQVAVMPVLTQHLAVVIEPCYERRRPESRDRCDNFFLPVAVDNLQPSWPEIVTRVLASGVVDGVSESGFAENVPLRVEDADDAGRG